MFTGLEGRKEGEIGQVEVDETGKGLLVGETEWLVWELVGRGIAVEKVGEMKGLGKDEGASLVVGVVARSAGLWENEKTVCSCTGKTLW